MLKQIREEQGLTQAALAEKSGLSLRTIQSWEQGRRSPVSPDFFKLVEALGASSDRFAEIAHAVATKPEPKLKRPRKPKAE